MGACATKPKVLKADSGEAPAPAPGPSPEDTTAGGGAAVETKLENGGDGKATEIADDDTVDSKSRSLSNLFNDQIESKDSDENEKKTAVDPSEKQETPPETEKQTNPLPPEPEPKEESSETNPPEPPPSHHVTDKTTIISDAVEIQSEEKSTTMTESKKEIIDPKNGQTIEDHKVKVEATVNDPIETEKGIEVISNQ